MVLGRKRQGRGWNVGCGKVCALVLMRTSWTCLNRNGKDSTGRERLNSR